jgi:hypothetical protein
MKNRKLNSDVRSYDYYEEENENYNRSAKKKRLAYQDKRRPVKNYKNAWSQHVSDYEEHDDFFSK